MRAAFAALKGRSSTTPIFYRAALSQGRSSTSQLAPDVFEIVETFFAGQPFGGADCAFGETAAGFGIVAEIDAVGGGFEDDFVQADDIAFAEGCDLKIFVFGRTVAAGLADQALERDCGAGGGVFPVSSSLVHRRANSCPCEQRPPDSIALGAAPQLQLPR